MRGCLFVFCLVAALVSNIACEAQLVKTASDLSKLKTEGQRFAGKSLANLLSQINLPITRVTAIDTQSPESNPGFFRFQFQSPKTIDSLKLNNKLPLGIVVYIKEAFQWDYFNRPTDKLNVWTAEDAAKYAALTVTRIRILQDSQ